MKIAREREAGSGPRHRDGTIESACGELGPEDIWREPVDRLLMRLATASAGLDSAEAQSRLATYGPNDAATVKRSPLWLQFLARFRNPLVIILLVASGLSAATGDVASFFIVAAIVTLSMTLDFAQEVRAENAVEALRRSVAIQATVWRDGTSLSVPIDHLVPGDIVKLIAGDLVPADARLLESRDLFVNQALLTGEPYPAEKRAGEAALGAENPAGASNAVFAGTSVISGTATILICRTGCKTALGNLATSLAEKPPATAFAAFAVGIHRFGMLIMRFTVLMVLFVLVVNISFHRPVLESLLFALVEHDAKHRLIVKGAPEDLLRLSGRYEAATGEELPLDAQTRRAFEVTLDALGAQGFRTLGIASRLVDVSHETAAVADESELSFLGFAVFLDPHCSSSI
jgi:P-type Mg2+ transporter